MATWVFAALLYLSGIGSNYGAVDAYAWHLVDQEPLCSTVYEGLDNALSGVLGVDDETGDSLRDLIMPRIYDNGRENLEPCVLSQ